MDPSYEVPSKLYGKVNSYQKTAGYLSILCAVITVILVCYFSANTNKDEGFLGGLDWNKLIFNWHPILMVVGLVLCSLTSILSYRILPVKKLYSKGFHVVLHTAAIICLSVGLSAVIIGNNDKSKNDQNIYYSNFCSIHSFVGLGAIVLYGQNYVLGFIHYLMPMAVEFRKRYMPSHIFLGSFALFAAIMAALTGAMELATEFHCGYESTEADTNPAENYHLLSKGCKTLNGVGVVLVLTGFFAAYALWDNHTPPQTAPESERSLMDGADGNHRDKRQSSLNIEA